ncbi:MAG: RNA polymerase sigma factor [Myxococcaceae bacterium]
MTLLQGDRQLLDAYRRGEVRALEKVYRTYSADVARYLAKGFALKGDDRMERTCLSSTDLQAVHQETFVRAFRPAVRLTYDGLRPFKAYLLSIARSAAVDVFRSAGKVAREWVSLDDAPNAASLPEDALDPEASALQQEVRRLVSEFLGARPSEEQRLAQLRFVEGQSQDATAEALGLTRGEVRVREKRLKLAFSEFLRRRGWFDQDGEPAKALVGITCILAVGLLPILWDGMGFAPTCDGRAHPIASGLRS